MKRIAHRGCAAQFPENTLRAFRSVAPHVDMIEFDLRRCASGELVVFHDETLSDLTNGSGTIAETELDELRTLDVLDSGESIPTLAELLDVVPPSVELNPELKEPGIETDTLTLLESSEHEYVISSFDSDHIREVRAASPATETALVFSSDPDRKLDLAASLGCDYVHPRYDLCDGTDLIDRAHERGFLVNVWTVPTAAMARRLRRSGADGLMVDELSVLETVAH